MNPPGVEVADAAVSCLEKAADPTLLLSNELFSAYRPSFASLPTSGSRQVCLLFSLFCCCRLDSGVCGLRTLEVRWQTYGSDTPSSW
jgi:hypothetical protein